MIRHRLACLGLGLLAGCGGGHGSHGGHGGALDHADLPAAPALLPTTPAPGLPALPVLADLDPAPDVVEVNLTAAPATVAFLPGKPAQVWAYNGTVPGPTLRAKVGDKVLVHFKNELPEATTIHWHGLRLPADMDGMIEVPAGGTYDYAFEVLDSGIFWFHPHMRTAVQVERGLYGAVVVDDPQAPALDTVADETLVLDDVLVSPQTGALDEAMDDRIDMMGREGNLVLVDGAPATRELSVRAGERRLWRLVNAASSRYFRLALAGGAMVRVGGDRGWLAAPEPASELLLVPGQRALVVVAAAPGQTATLQALPYERAMGAGHTEAVDLVRLVPDAEPPATPAALPPTLATVPALAAPVATRSLVLDERMKAGAMADMGHGAAGMMEFTINGQVFPNVPAIAAKRGTVELWQVRNDSMMDHPFHLHGFSFQREGSGEWQDTVNVPAEATVHLLAAFDDRPGAVGTWVYHCHILEHADRGMAGTVEVE